MKFSAERLKKAREQKGISQYEVARLIKANTQMTISQSAICQFENGDCVPSGNRVGALAEVLGVSVDYLYGRGE